MSGTIRVLLADDHPLMTEGLKLTIGAWEEFEVVAVAADGRAALEQCVKLLPDLAVLDMQMPGLSGPEVIREIRERAPGVKTVALTTFDDDRTVRQAMEAGCNAFLLKVIEPEKLRSSLLSVAGGMNVYDSQAMGNLLLSMERVPQIAFTSREEELLASVSKGMTNTEIADGLGLRPGTVKNMISLLLSKTGCISRAQLARYAAERGIR